MSKARPEPFLVRVLVTFAAIFFVWLWVHGITDAYFYKEKGIPATPTVLELRGVRHAGKAGNYYRYLLELSGRQFESELFNKLEPGKRYDVLISPENPNKLVIGTPNDSALRIYSSQMGGGFWGWLGVFILPLITAGWAIQEMATRRIQKRKWYVLPTDSKY